MKLQNLTVHRIIIHQIYQRDENGNRVEPFLSHEFTNFDPSAMSAFKSRVNKALGEDSKAVQMDIVRQDANDLPTLVDKMCDQDDEEFTLSSFEIAMKLANAQHRRSIPGGILVAFSGIHGYSNQPFLGLIKAEIHSGYEKVLSDTNEISLKFVEEVLLTPGTRLYKTAGFFRKPTKKKTSDLNDRWTAFVSDYQIGQSEGKAAAQYFYADFLGVGYPQTSARTTHQFYTTASSFIESLDIPTSDKSDLFNALITYLKVDTSSTIGASEFAARYFDTDTQDDFVTHMRDAGLPTIEFTKDIEHIKNTLRYRRVRFSKNVRIAGPADVFKDLVTIESIEGEKDDNGTAAEWTKVIIKDRIIHQE